MVDIDNRGIIHYLSAMHNPRTSAGIFQFIFLLSPSTSCLKPPSSLPLDPIFSQRNFYLPIFLPQPTSHEPSDRRRENKVKNCPTKTGNEMGNLCSRDKCIRRREIETAELQDGVMSSERGGEETAPSTGVRTTASGSNNSGSRTSHVPTTATRGTRTIQRRGAPGVPGRSEAAIEAMTGGRGTKNAERARD
ncbi:hypothetical protein L873DRAFT_1813040 [Choiromyces venosus 120613-1]|uniref:Uncharacterized protein n=1 Tax=Choiromyces venosus 120613-1 TaxID=1336337 RepID=A0A3N4JG23_9PEZI|nr:hypothetical protein L873DRAFT_1813040 [Choiromyces venosus 120613-1]